MIGASTAVVLAPVLKKGFCHYLSFFGFCGGHHNLAHVNQEVRRLNSSVKTIEMGSQERFHLVIHSLNQTSDRLSTLAHDANENFRKLKLALEDYATTTQGVPIQHCWTYRDHAVYASSIIWAASITNFTTLIQSWKSEMVAYKVGLYNFGNVLDDALNSLANGRLPATLVQPEQLLKMLEGLQLRDVHESIPRKDFLTYYNFELVSATVLTENGLNIQLNIPVHHTDGYHDVYRAIAVPQPIDDRPTATRYKLDRTVLLVSRRKDSFAEISEGVLHSHCRGSSRFRLCMKPFATSRSSASTCLSSLFSGLDLRAMKICPQEVIMLPEDPVAEYLEDSTYLITSRKDNEALVNYTEGSK